MSRPWKLVALAVYPEQLEKIRRAAELLPRTKGGKTNTSLAIRWLIDHAPDPKGKRP